MIPVQVRDDGLMLPVRVTPKGGRDSVLSFQPGDLAVRVKVSSPPEDGQANAAVIRLLAEVLSLPKSRLSIRRGETSRYKQIAVDLSESQPDALLTRLAVLMKQESAACCFELTDSD